MLAALVIVFREAVEAGLVIGIVLAATRGVPGRGRRVAEGIAAGIAGALAVAAFAGEIADAFLGSGQELLNAAVLAVAVTMLGWHNVWMAGHGREMAAEMRRIGGDIAAGRRPLTALTVVVGMAVLREGSETALFLYGVAAGGGGSAATMLLGAAIGLAAAAALSALLYFGLLSVPTRHLFTVTTGLVTLLAAGLASQAIAFLQQAGVVEMWSAAVWDTSWLLSDGGLPGRLLHTLIGYTAAPTGLQAVAYLSTIAAILGLMRLARGTPRLRPTVEEEAS